MPRREDLLLLASLTFFIGVLALFATRPHPRGSLSGVDAALRIDVNTASAATLAVLPRIGPALAKRIVADRQTNGPFRSLEDLERVPGIGPKTLQHLAPYAGCMPMASPQTDRR